MNTRRQILLGLGALPLAARSAKANDDDEARDGRNREELALGRGVPNR